MDDKSTKSHGHIVFSRRVGDTICIGKDVKVRVVAIEGNQIRLLVIAPKSIAVDREEIALRKSKEASLHD